MQAQDVALPQQRSQLNPDRARLLLELRLPRARRVEQRHAERARAPPNGAADSPCAQQAQRAAPQLQAEKLLRELRQIKLAIWTAILLALFFFALQKITEAIIGPPPPPTVSVQPPR